MYYYIINPAAGKGAINHIQDRLRERLKQLGISGEFAKTTGLGDATKMAKLAIEKGHNTIVAVGGDETVNEVINGVTKDSVAVGIIPIGRSNTLANHLGIPDWQSACETLASRRLSSYGLIGAGQKYFLSTLTLGFETDVEKRVESGTADLKSQVINFKKGWGHAQNFTPLSASLKVDDQFELKCQLFSMTIANQKFEDPLADNKLVISIAGTPNNKQLTYYLWQLLRRQSPLTDSATTRFFANRVLIETKPSTGIMIDGKLSGRTPIAIRLTDRRIKFITGKQQTGLQSHSLTGKVPSGRLGREL